MQLPQRRDGGMHGGSGRQTVVNQNHSAIADVEEWPAAAIKTLAACEFLSLADRNSIDQMVWNAKTIHQLIVEHAHAACRDGAHRQLLGAGNAQLAHDKDIQGCAERAGYFIRDGHTATRQRQYDHIRPIGVGGELCCQQL